MGLTTQDREIGGVVYRVQQHPARRALRLQARIGKVAGALLSSVSGGKGLAEVDVGSLVERVFDTLSPDDFEKLAEDLFACTQIVEPSGALVPLWPVFDTRMQGRTMDVYKLGAFVLEVNFRDFFDALGRKPPPAAAPGSTSPST